MKLFSGDQTGHVVITDIDYDLVRIRKINNVITILLGELPVQIVRNFHNFFSVGPNSFLNFALRKLRNCTVELYPQEPPDLLYIPVHNILVGK